ncbi:conserved hypothetical protein [Leptospira interrogans serovar Manilae]|uniref:Uncharacterized protein n=1 Tax=Leptospira interrogans serovar Manilae TaxID=214675 RepID=A0AAQ1NUP2_LEPIR|nr:hypothetical protein LIMLP_14905 [Leptospira interrogans serovar Manilae]AKP30860.1 hypothetical protein LIMHP_14905 [Leptospira interrogans serovar Manilae]EYU63609.1 hypothetical protein CI00_12685 [Leptospira interrogans serovar Manilae]SOR60103.1 conserved hypothetical protein [Leptospira interrogans serovar Manilae]
MFESKRLDTFLYSLVLSNQVSHKTATIFEIQLVGLVFGSCCLFWDFKSEYKEIYLLDEKKSFRLVLLVFILKLVSNFLKN